MKIVLALMTLALCGAATDPANAIRYTGDITPANIVPGFDNGHLVVYELRAGVSVYGRDGSLAFHFDPPAKAVVWNVAVDTDGSAAVAMEFGYGQPPERSAIAILDPAGARKQLIELEDYVPFGVAFAPDRSIWSIGGRLFPNGPAGAGYEMLRHYSREGRELGRYLPRSSFASTEPAHGVVGFSMLRIAGGRVGAYLAFGGRERGFWIESELSGKEIGRWPVDLDGDPAALAGDGAVYARTVSGTMTLDRASGQWKATAIAGPGALIGSDGGDLIFLVRGENSVQRVPVH